ncbi:U3 snoRNA associated-domain-containing protein [Aspergillus cavernicola]|uniref:U3 snoRNA associated-domain-containing protein n=1 Tax=Aspergillus cavernicola TaxID=176166 RepID=A0ABR4IYV9_9EURO
MLSQLVTAARGLIFPGNHSNSDANITATELETTATATNPKMVTTRRSEAHAVIPTEVETNLGLESNGKRKSENGTSITPKDQNNKRRKKTTIQVVEEEVKADSKEDTEPGKHFRFDSEEPEFPESTEPEMPTSAQPEVQDDADDSSDDEAPETVDNSAQLSRMKSDAKKRERARQLEEQLKREKRRQLDEARKGQAKASGKRKGAPVSQIAPGAGTPEDLVSESSATLQGSITQDARRQTLPALLPDDILNAVPEIRPPTPPPETQSVIQKKPTKLRFLDKKEKAPKDVRMGDVAIRVLDSDNSRKQFATALPPKSSKTGRGAKDAWLKQARSTGYVNGMRMASSGSKGFVRK